MAMSEVSTRSVAEIDLEPSRFTSRLSGYENLVTPSTASSVLPPGVLPTAQEEQEQCDVIVYSTSSEFGPRRLIQPKKKVAVGEKPEGGGQASFRVSLDDVASFVRPTYASKPCSAATPSHVANRQTRVYVTALTNWLRLVAHDERSRPILDIEEEALITPVRPIKAQAESRISISPGLRRKERKTTTTGLGYVSAGLLLWLESSSESEEDA
ncbi:hypothetical protein LCGC14_2033320 [marine sediment metagenome]|uniref:Uncharacterized protein n=1 Tax=marine sediment metagenome TaxID=412755 RepID=A0A0F9FGK3_9ZZZZ